ncbi:hypothetical protein ANTRET_LOCUS667 [Anthophora retusa]
MFYLTDISIFEVSISYIQDNNHIYIRDNNYFLNNKYRFRKILQIRVRTEASKYIYTWKKLKILRGI